METDKLAEALFTAGNGVTGITWEDADPAFWRRVAEEAKRLLAAPAAPSTDPRPSDIFAQIVARKRELIQQIRDLEDERANNEQELAMLGIETEEILNGIIQRKGADQP